MPENKDDIDLEGWDLHRAAKENRSDIARSLIARGDDIEAKDDDGWTALNRAASCNSLDVARLLIENGAEVNASNKYGWTALYHAASRNSLDVAQLLIEHGANTDGIDLSWMDEQEDA